MSNKKETPKQNNAVATREDKIEVYDKRIGNLRVQVERIIGGIEVLEKLKQELIDEKEKDK